jgi:hypothetical protein
MPITGTDFEKLVEPFFRELFTKMGFFVLQVRRQDSGDQRGFDISISFVDDNSIEREFFIECKYYTTSPLYWSEILNKQVQLDASNHKPTAFILLSPLKNLSNIDHNSQAKITKTFKFPADFWTPDKEIKKLFALDECLYKKVFDVEECDTVIDKEEEIKKLKIRVNLLIQKKDALKYSEVIRIYDYGKEPNEDQQLKTTLDEKLNSILEPTDNKRIEYHRIRANYKVYLENLNDVNTELRGNILAWESDLRLKADRLTNNFVIDDTYSPQRFFHDFFNIAEQEIITFYKDFEFRGDKEKLLQGVVFELAAQCPLDWRKNG